VTLAERIRALRKRQGHTQEEFAEILGTHVNTIIRWENGQRIPGADKLRDLAAALGTTVAYLVEGDKEKEAPAETETSLAYWGEMVDRARAVAKRGNREEIADILPLLEKALFAMENASMAAGIRQLPTSPVVDGGKRRPVKHGNAV